MRPLRRVLAIETSCDDTSVALIENDARVAALLSAHQDLTHRKFGGIVPELASRDHSEHLLPLIEKAFEISGLSWKDIDGVAVTSRPGLLGSLLVGVVTAKTLAMAEGLPWITVNHLEGHLLAVFLKDDTFEPPPGFTFPYLALAISGGHSHLYEVQGGGQYKVLGQTLDDAAGEAFDKVAKMMNLPYPGGPEISRLAELGDPKKYQLPVVLL
ncbi:MAG: tRNA (adenosine(37)-N6)-threonylcarbamoyltransferase complex transferase subunit TsaD, partial [Bdellovibrionales bacterium]|nr:tRNA (adenosine(37)-N6)-threonylcarbamoyltransferase complex transferase subunit TsaD [Bdellovibrionales bacterium]